MRNLIVEPRPHRPTAWERFSSGWKRFVDWIGRYSSSVMLCLAGAILVALGVWVVPDQQAVATTLVVFGASAIIFGAVLPRLEGPFTFGPDGLTAVLTAVMKKVREGRVADEQMDAVAKKAAELAYGTAAGRIGLRSAAVGHAVDAVISPPEAEAIAESAIEEVTREANESSSS